MKEKSKIVDDYLRKIELIKKHNNHYYIKDKPIITDSDYDNLKKEVITLEKKYLFWKNLVQLVRLWVPRLQISSLKLNIYLQCYHYQMLLTVKIWKFLLKKLITF